MATLPLSVQSVFGSSRMALFPLSDRWCILCGWLTIFDESSLDDTRIRLLPSPEVLEVAPNFTTSVATDEPIRAR